MQFAANLSMMFQEHPFLNRFGAAARAGFDRVEFLFPYEWPSELLAEQLDENNQKQVLFNLSPGNWDAGERGLACLPGREAEFRDSVVNALDYAKRLSCPRLHAMAGIIPEGAAHDELRETYVQNISYAAKTCASNGVTLLIEPINVADMPGYFLKDFDMALDVINEVAADVGERTAPRLQFDIYHCAKIHGDVVRWIEKCGKFTEHYQIAGIPDRHEPDIGSLPVADIFAAVKATSPGLTVGCEYRPSGVTEAGLGWRDKVRQQL